VKILVVAAPLLGHVLPLVPLAVALREAGHEVRVACGGGVTEVNTRGLPVDDVAGGLHLGRVTAGVVLRRPGSAVRERGGRAGTAVVGELFGRVNAGLVDAVVDLARRWRPDLVVHEPLAVAGAVAAARLGVPAVLQENSLADGPALVAATLTSPALRAALHHHGLDDLPAPALVLTVAPRSVVGPRAGLPLRAVPPEAGGEAPEWLRRPCYRPRIVVSRSTAPGASGADPARAVAAAAVALDAEVVLVRPRGHAAHRGLAGSVRRTGWVPLDQVLPHATALVHHGGAGSALGALAAGLPQLVVPGAGDRRSTAELLAARGAALAVPVREISTEVLSHLVRDPGLRCAAQEVQREMAGMPAPARLVDALEEVARHRLRA
jgi:UDP:flavonoid glycosyltransferase YjiC (YdhE family)